MYFLYITLLTTKHFAIGYGTNKKKIKKRETFGYFGTRVGLWSKALRVMGSPLLGGIGYKGER